MEKSDNIIGFREVVSNTHVNNPLNMFPILYAITDEGDYENILACQYLTKDGYRYVILGKYVDGYYPSFQDDTCLKWFRDLEQLLEGPDYGYSLEAYLKQLRKITSSTEMNNILFTQEGFDLLTGKHFFLRDGGIQRTIAVETFQDEDNFSLGTYYSSVNSEGKMTHLSLFDTWENYEKNYFLNKQDLTMMVPGDIALLYAVLNKDRLFRYVKDNYAEWALTHNLDSSLVSPEEVARYSLQLVDVVTNFQLEKNQEKESMKVA